MTEVRFFYVDFGYPWWHDATQRLVASAKVAMPQCRVVHMTNQTTPMIPGADCAMREQSDVSEKNMMLWKGALWAVTGISASVPTVLVDADVEITRNMGPLFTADWDVAVFRRGGNTVSTAQPYLAAAVLTRPTEGAVAFWEQYYKVLTSLPKMVHAWWCDQLAFALMIGIRHRPGDIVQGPGWKVGVFDAADMIGEGKYLLHHKGQHDMKKVLAA